MTLILNLSNTVAQWLIKLICQRLAWAQWPWKSILIRYDASQDIFTETGRNFWRGLTDCDGNYLQLIGCNVLYATHPRITSFLCPLCFFLLPPWPRLDPEPWPPPPSSPPMRALIGSVSWDLIYWPLGSYQTLSVLASKLGVNSIGWLRRLGLSERLTVTIGSHWAPHTACVLLLTMVMWCC